MFKLIAIFVVSLIAAVASQSTCGSCDPNLTNVTTVGNSAHPFASICLTYDSNSCARRSFTCVGLNANIEVNGGVNGIVFDSDQGTPGTVSLDLTCNSAGTGWEYLGVTVTQLECASATCKNCDPNLIAVTTAGGLSHPFASVTSDNTAGCTKRIFTCQGPNANVEVNGGDNGVIFDSTQGTPGTVVFDVTCNSAGTGWEHMGVAITQLECASGCTNCNPNMITTTTVGNGAHPFASITTDTTGECPTRVFVCEGVNANIEVNGGVNGIVFDSDQGTPGTVRLGVICNAAASGWTYGGMIVTQLECASAIVCKNCDPNLIAVTTVGNGAKPFASITSNIVNGCARRSFTCVGLHANIEVNAGVNGIITDASQGTPGTVTFDVTCNSAGTGWQYMGMAVTQLECASG